MLMADGDILLKAYLPPELKSDEAAGMQKEEAIVPLETAELRHLQWTLAARLGISERTPYRKLAV